MGQTPQPPHSLWDSCSWLGWHWAHVQEGRSSGTLSARGRGHLPDPMPAAPWAQRCHPPVPIPERKHGSAGCLWHGHQAEVPGNWIRIEPGIKPECPGTIWDQARAQTRLLRDSVKTRTGINQGSHGPVQDQAGNRPRVIGAWAGTKSGPWGPAGDQTRAFRDQTRTKLGIKPGYSGLDQDQAGD